MKRLRRKQMKQIYKSCLALGLIIALLFLVIFYKYVTIVIGSCVLLLCGFTLFRELL